MSRIIKKGGKSRLLTGDGRVLSLEELQQLYEQVILGSRTPYVTGSQLFKPAKWSYHRGRGGIRGTAAKYYIVFPPGKDGMKETIEKLLEKSGKRDLADLLGIRPGGYELVRLMHARPRKSRQMKSPRDISTLLDLYRLKNAAPRRPRPNAISIDSSLHSQAEIEKMTVFFEENNIDVTWLDSAQLGKENSLQAAITYLNSPEAVAPRCNIMYGYDYAWVKRAIDKRLFPGAEKIRNYSFPQFKRYMEQLGFKNVAGAKTLAKYYNQAEGTKLPWTYKDCTDRRDEALRRNRIVGKFLEMMYEAWEVIKKDGESAITGGQRG